MLPTMLMIVVIYLYGIPFLLEYMNQREAMSLKLPMQVYNILQITFNAYIVYGLFHNFTIKNIFGLNTVYNEKTEYFVYLHYISKYIDYFDTVFIILRKNNGRLTFLHVYHHASIAPIWGILLCTGNGYGTVSFGCMINSFIHVIMYSHYLYTSFGYKNPFKKLITQAQITQFVLCLIHAVCTLLYENVIPSILSWIQLVYHIQMIYLFHNFYKDTYKLSA